MAQETEIKLKINDLKGFRRALRRLGAKPIPGLERTHEENIIFDTPQGGLAKHGQLLRIRAETSQARGKRAKAARSFIVTFKRPPEQREQSGPMRPRDDGYKVREEFETKIADAAIMTNIFEGLGMRGWFRYEKYRTTYRITPQKNWAKGLLIEIDETPVGIYAELEGPAVAIDRAAKELGFSKRDYILKNYLTLYVEDCRQKGEEPKDMLFSRGKSG